MRDKEKQLGRLTEASERPTREVIRMKERERKVTGGRGKPRGDNGKYGRE
jgi:hypothetical protein